MELKNIVESDIEIIYKNNVPYGIRDKNGFLIVFAKVQKFSGQEERYQRELEQQVRLADYLSDVLKARVYSRKEVLKLLRKYIKDLDEAFKGQKFMPGMEPEHWLEIYERGD